MKKHVAILAALAIIGGSSISMADNRVTLDDLYRPQPVGIFDCSLHEIAYSSVVDYNTKPLSTHSLGNDLEKTLSSNHNRDYRMIWESG